MSYARRLSSGRVSMARFVVAVVLLVTCDALVSSTAHGLTKSEDQQIDRGFKRFMTSTFKGNGRTCGTCHAPQFDYNISPVDIATLSAHQKGLVLATKAPNLENATLTNTLGLFNITNSQPGDPGVSNIPAGPFRTSMALGGLKFTTLDLCENSGLISSISSDAKGVATVTMAEPVEFFVGESFRIANSGTGFDTNDPPLPQVTSLILPSVVSGVLSTTQFTFQSSVINGTYTGPGASMEAVGACPGAAINPIVAIDNGNRNIELGWSGNGVPMPADPTSIFPGPEAADCVDAVDQFKAHPTSLFFGLRAFSLGAVRHHASRTLNRIPGSDYRCPTSQELDDMADFQMYLGRQFELALCSNSSPSEICTGAIFNATTFAKGQNGTQQLKFLPNFSSLADPSIAVSSSAPLQNVITFRDDKGGTTLTNNTAEKGKAIFLDSRALCNRCHFNGGAQDTGADALGEPALTDSAGNPVSSYNTATTWTPNTKYIAAVGQNSIFKNYRWSVVIPTGSNQPFFFLALLSNVPTCNPVDFSSCFPEPAAGLSSATEPDWTSAPNLGDTISDNQITWMNFGIASQRLNSPARNFTHGNFTEELATNDLVVGANTVAASLDTQVSPVQIPFDPGNIGSLPDNSGDFNTQSIIEAARKSFFFHNGAFSGGAVEDAANFYFSTIFDDSGAGAALQRATGPAGRGNLGSASGPCQNLSGTHAGCGALALESLADTYEGGHSAAQQQQVFNDLGFFLRSLSVVYSIADCERLVQDTIDRVNFNLPTSLPLLNCSTNLSDVTRVIEGARVKVPRQYTKVARQAEHLASSLDIVPFLYGPFGVDYLEMIKQDLISMRHSIGTIDPATPDLP